MNSKYDEEITRLTLQKRDLLIQHDKGEIDTKLFKERLHNITIHINELTQKKIAEIKNKVKKHVTEITEEQKKLKNKIEEQKKFNRQNAGRKQNPNSFSSLIFNALQEPKLNDEDKVVSMVKTWKDNDENKLRVQVRNIISMIKKGKQKRYKGYTWDDKNYKIVNEV